MEPGNRDDEQMAVRHADASGGYIIENQHEEKRMRDIQVSRRGSGQQVKDNRTNGGRQNDSSMNLRIHSHLPIHVLPWNILRAVRHEDRPGSVLVQKSGHVDDDVHISA